MGIAAAVGTGIGTIASTIGAGAGALGLDAATAATVGSIGADALVGAGTGAALSAVTGGKPLQGALVGGLTGGAGAAGGILGAGTALGAGGGGAIGGALGGAAGNAMTGGNALTGAAEGALGGYFAGSGIGSGNGGNAGFSPGSASGADSAAYSTNNFNDPTLAAAMANTTGVNSGDAGTTNLNPVSQAAGGTGSAGSNSGGAAGSLRGNAGLSNEALALGALSAAGSLFTKPKIGTWQTPQPGSNSANLGPYFNSPLNTSAPGRTTIAPAMSIPGATQPESSWYTYGQQPVPNPFTNNSLAAYGFAHGGALNREFATHGTSRRVRGPGTGTSDSVPARLSDGEYVLTAADVERIGRGSNQRGAEILDHDRGALARALGEAKFTRRKLRSAR